jgi:hypothetical protein
MPPHLRHRPPLRQPRPPRRALLLLPPHHPPAKASGRQLPRRPPRAQTLTPRHHLRPAHDRRPRLHPDRHRPGPHPHRGQHPRPPPRRSAPLRPPDRRPQHPQAAPPQPPRARRRVRHRHRTRPHPGRPRPGHRIHPRIRRTQLHVPPDEGLRRRRRRHRPTRPLHRPQTRNPPQPPGDGHPSERDRSQIPTSGRTRRSGIRGTKVLPHAPCLPHPQ